MAPCRGGRIVFENGGFLYVLDPASGGGYATVPEFGTYNLKSEWIIENHGVDPDIEVDNLPQDEMAGRDAQLERGIEEVMKRIEAKTPSFPPRPPSRNLVDPRAGDHVAPP